MCLGRLNSTCAWRLARNLLLMAAVCGTWLISGWVGLRELHAADSPDSITVANADVRTWNDADGKHSVRARLVRIEGEKIALLRPDGREVKVALATLSAADREYVDKMKSANSAGAANPSPLEEDGLRKSQPNTRDVLPADSGVEVDIGLAMPIDLAGDGSWKYQPEAAEANPVVTPLQVPLSVAMADHHVAMRTLLLPREKKALVAFRPGGGKSLDEADTAYVCDYDRGRIEARIATGSETPVAVSPDGTLLLLSRQDSDGHSGGATLTVCSRRST
jgi:SLA1 homology domain 1, SHD1